MSFLPNSTVEAGGDTKEDVIDISGNDILEDILKELKAIKLQLSLMTDTIIDSEEL